MVAMIPVPPGSPTTQTYRQNATIYNVGAFHGAIDFAIPIGTDIVAPEDGVVVFDGWAWDLPGGPDEWDKRWFLIKPPVGQTKVGGGILTIIQNASGSHWGFAHASKSFLNKGDRVRQGQVIQEGGSTGSSTGPHTHVNLWPARPTWTNGAFGAIDPAPWLTKPYRKLVAGAPADTSGATMHGIDYSNWQPTLNPRVVPADFIGVLATDGRTFKSPTLDDQMPDAMSRTKRTMVYHFARVAQSDSDTQAKHFLKAAKKYIAAGAVPVLDWEEDAWNHRADWAIDWIKYVEKATGKRVWIYQRQLAAAHPSWGTFRRPMWLSWYGSKARIDGYRSSFVVPPVPGWDVVLWQYTDNGWLPGYDGPLDLNVAFGDPWGLALTGTGSAVLDDPLKEIGIMSQADFDRYMDSYLDRKAGADRVGRAVVDFKFTDNQKRWIHLGQFLTEYRDQKDLLAEALAGPRLSELIEKAAPGSNITADDLAAALLRQITTPKEA